jgi:lipopolysaccharide/colanic/teichoic acid biosynthesis glycosyltransferase
MERALFEGPSQIPSSGKFQEIADPRAGSAPDRKVGFGRLQRWKRSTFFGILVALTAPTSRLTVVLLAGLAASAIALLVLDISVALDPLVLVACALAGAAAIASNHLAHSEPASGIGHHDIPTAFDMWPRGALSAGPDWNAHAEARRVIVDRSELEIIVELLSGKMASIRDLAGGLSLTNRMLKRAIDLAVVMLALPIALPMMLMVAIAVKIDSPGPVFFIQRRVGRGNGLFNIIKFRTMRRELADSHGTRSTERGDLRLTQLGRLLRNTSLDELPQIINVLAGHMSIVGPRPHALASTADSLLFWDIEQRYWERHVVKPGMTGLAQVRGYRGATVSRMDLSNRLEADLEYLATWSVWRDIKIIFLTFRVLIHRNAF